MYNKVKKLLLGMLARSLNAIVPVKRGLWIFGSDYGNMYREGSKYLIEYMLEHHSEYDCRFVTQSRKVYKELASRNIPCVMNLSLRGVWVAARAECVFTTQDGADIVYAFKKHKRRYFYLVHGQSYKIAILALSKTNYRQKAIFTDVNPIVGFFRKIRAWLSFYFVCDYGCLDSEFVSATSEFLSKWQKNDFGEKMPSIILGMPRNDALFQPRRMRDERWIADADDKLVVSYMPTHRLYGRGAVSPTPFRNRPDIQEWMKKNDVLLVVKNHPNMLRFNKDMCLYESSCIKDITAAGIDPMTVLYHSDALITDYSSVWMDYLLLKRPLIFYIYDDFEHDDVGVYYDIKEERVGHFCYSEDELFGLIKKVKSNYDSMRPNEDVVRKFHKYVDGNSCARYYNEITQTNVSNA